MDFPKSVPNVGLVNGRFVDENVGTGQPGSLIPAVWGNSVTDEILGVITGAGLTPDEAQLNQLFLGIQELVKKAKPPNATEATIGVARFGTQDEINNAANGDVAVSPKTLGVKFTEYFKQATETVLGFARIATQAQTNSGVDDTRFVTPKKFSAGLAALIVQATTLIPGIARIGTQTEVNNSSANDLIVTPLTLGVLLTNYVKQATTLVAGIARTATQALVNAGVDTQTIVTPATLRFGVAYSLTLQGYIILPTWLGGFTVQWGSVGSAGTVNFPTAFAAAYIAIASSNVNGNYTSTGSLTTTSVVLSNSGNQAMTWLAFGRV